MTPLDAQCKMIFDRISDSIVTFDHNGNIIYKNKVFEFLMINLKSETQRAEALNKIGRAHV